jgi:hypothetical protein
MILKFLLFFFSLSSLFGSDFQLKGHYANKDYYCTIENLPERKTEPYLFYKFRLGCTFFKEVKIGNASGSLFSIIVHKDKEKYLELMNDGNQYSFLPMTDNCYISRSIWKAVDPLDFKKYKTSPEKYEKYRVNFLAVFEELRHDIAKTDFCRFPRI